MSDIRTIEETYSVFAQWLGIPEAREELLGLIPEATQQQIRDRFYCDLAFGTGGLRGVMGAGTNRMNAPVVAMATQGLANYIRRVAGRKRPVAVVCYDARHNSPLFAQVTAEVFAGNGFVAHLFKQLRLTPEISFAVRELGADVGVMITASHNPPEYNGYKAYGADGGQMIAPHDVGVIAEVRKIASLSQVNRMPLKAARSRGLIQMIGAEMDRKYLTAVAKASLDPKGNQRNGASVAIVYSPLHGVGGTLAKKALNMWGFSRVHEVASEIYPDPDFTNVKSANPENREAFEGALKLMEKTRADIAVASDPDADRMGMVARDGQGRPQFLTGNQMAAVFAYYQCETLSAAKRMPPNPLMVSTIVTSDLYPKIGEAYGVEVVKTLTGFKWIGNVATVQDELRAAGKPAKTFLFGCEESYGYLFGTHCRDKDGIVSLCMAAEIARWAKERGQTIPDLLDVLYQRFGVFDESQVSVYMRGETGMQRIQAIMARLRAKPPRELAGRKVAGMTDFYEVAFKDANGRTIRGPKQLPEANVLLFEFEGGSKVVARPSGTEPKIKFYFNLCDTQGAPFASAGEVSRRKKALAQFAARVKDAFLDYAGTRD